MELVNRIKVSVLVPVYGVEKYIESCVKSLFEQSMKDGIEFIFVDDCSPDRSIEILKDVLNDYLERIPQVKIIRHEENRGLSEARVTALSISRGEYVIHCDSDDWVEPTMYEVLYAKAKETDADIVGCDCMQVFPKKSYIRKQAFYLPHNELVIELIKGEKIEAYLWNRLIKRSFYVQGGYRADKGITLLEDMAVTVPMHMNTTNVGYVPLPLYNYRCTDKFSMSARLNDKSVKSAVEVLYNLSLIRSRDIWQQEILQRLKNYLFCRALSFSARDIKKWKLFELPFLLTHSLPLSMSEIMTIKLIQNNYIRSQYVVFILDKMVRVLARYFKRIK